MQLIQSMKLSLKASLALEECNFSTGAADRQELAEAAADTAQDAGADTAHNKRDKSREGLIARFQQDAAW